MDDYNLYNEYSKMDFFPKSLKSGFYFAYLKSLESKHFRPMGACIIINHSIRCGCNKDKTHPIFSNGKEFYTIHAEMDCILKTKLRTDLSKAELYIYRESNNCPAMAKPCKNCMKYLIEFGIKTIYYTIPEFPYYERIDL